MHIRILHADILQILMQHFDLGLKKCCQLINQWIHRKIIANILLISSLFKFFFQRKMVNIHCFLFSHYNK